MRDDNLPLSFRADLLDSIMYKVGILAALRSKKLNGATIGVMITASHNPEEVNFRVGSTSQQETNIGYQDNGVKLVDPRGEMLEQSWESYATQLANANDGETLAQVIDQIVSAHNIDLEASANVIYAHDTRYV